MLHIVTIAARFAKFTNDVQRRYRLQFPWDGRRNRLSPEQIVARTDCLQTQAGQAQAE